MKLVLYFIIKIKGLCMDDVRNAKIIVDVDPTLSVVDVKIYTIEKQHLNYDHQMRTFLFPERTETVSSGLGLEEHLAQLDKNHAQMRTLEQSIKQNEARMAKLNQELAQLKRRLTLT